MASFKTYSTRLLKNKLLQHIPVTKELKEYFAEMILIRIVMYLSKPSGYVMHQLV
jgi:hypothetical protein